MYGVGVVKAGCQSPCVIGRLTLWPPDQDRSPQHVHRLVGHPCRSTDVAEVGAEQVVINHRRDDRPEKDDGERKQQPLADGARLGRRGVG